MPSKQITWLEYEEDYTITDIGEEDLGGKVNLLTALPEAEQVIIRRETEQTQETPLNNNMRINADVLENMYDKPTMILQELEAKKFNKDDVIDLKREIGEDVEAYTDEHFISEEELNAAILVETTDRQAEDLLLQQQIDQEILNREDADNNLQDQINTLYEEKPINLTGALLTRVIHGFTPVQKILFDSSAVFIEGKTLISDVNGTIGVYKEDIDSSTIEVETLSVTPYAGTEPTHLGVVPDNISLPATVDQAVTDRGWHTPRIDDYATVQRDETQGDLRIEWYVTAIEDGNITWGNPVPLNTGDYQQQTAAQDAGKVLTGGASTGTFGQSIPIDIQVTENSANLITSGAVNNAMTITLEHPVEDDTLPEQIVQPTLFRQILGMVWNKLLWAMNSIKINTTYTYVVDSDSSFANWVNNASGNNYARVLVKSGTWNYNWTGEGGTSLTPLRILNLAVTGTDSVIGEAGAVLQFTPTGTTTTHIACIYGRGTTKNEKYFFRDFRVYVNGASANISTVSCFRNCSTLNNCGGYFGSGATTKDSFYSCNYLSSCYASGGDNGYYSCNYLSSCYASGGGNGYYSCNYLSSCCAGGGGNGYYSCNYLSSCYASGGGSNSFPFNNCRSLYGCNGAHSSSQYPAFLNCRTGFGCRATTGMFGNCYMDQDTATPTSMWANTAAGGWNLA